MFSSATIQEFSAMNAKTIYRGLFLGLCSSLLTAASTAAEPTAEQLRTLPQHGMIVAQRMMPPPPKLVPRGPMQRQDLPDVASVLSRK